MNILAHRGCWNRHEERNTISALFYALSHGFGIETDIRDYKEQLVVSHDIADRNSILLEDLFEYYSCNSCRNLLALNVKADGIQILLKSLLDRYQISNYFLFDMSIPEMVVNCGHALKFYTRQSDIENECVMYDYAQGVWIDSFFRNDWCLPINLIQHIQNGKKVCVVSPELHSRPYIETWELLKSSQLYRSDAISLCTDLPQQAEEYFYE